MLIAQSALFEYAQNGCKITCIVTGEKWKQNTYIITEDSSSKMIIVDPGDEAELIIKLIEGAGGTVTRILLTHPHHDHVGAAEQVSKYFNVACEVHKQDVRLLMHAPMYALTFAHKKIPPVSYFLQFAELCPVGKEPAVRSVHTPGHTKGSVCFVFDGFVLTGDTLLYKHVGRTDLPGSSAEDMVMSIGKLLDGLADEITIFPGHGQPWSVGEAKRWWSKTESCPPKYDNFVQL